MLGKGWYNQYYQGQTSDILLERDPHYVSNTYIVTEDLRRQEATFNVYYWAIT